MQLTIQADPGSIVYLLAEDERNRLLGTGNDLYQYQVTDKSFIRSRGDTEISIGSGLSEHALALLLHSVKNRLKLTLILYVG